MIRLTTLGTTDLRNDAGHAIGSVIRQPRRFALLVYLALESRRGFLRRDRVLAIFWPEVTTEQGRRNLSQALHYLRHSLGPEALANRGQDEVRLDLGMVACDACAFLDAIEAADAEAAVRLHAGEFLPGFFCSGVPDFDAWLEQTRAELRRHASDAGWAAAERACDRREWVTAAAHARRAAEVAGEDEASVRRLMSFLAGLGDRAGALEAYDALARKLQREYQAEPSEATRRLAADVRELEHATAAETDVAVTLQPVDLAAPVSPPAAAAATAAEAAGWRGTVRRRLDAVRTVVVSSVLMAAFISLWALTSPDEPRTGAVTGASLLVEEARGSSALSPVLTAELVRQLDGDRIDVLVDGTAARGEQGQAELALRTVFDTRGDTLQGTLTLVDRATGRSLASDRVSGTLANAEETTRLAQLIARFARRGVGDELERRRALVAGVEEEVLLDLRRARRLLAVADSLDAEGLRTASRAQYATTDSQVGLIESRAERWAELPVQRAEIALRRMWAYVLPPESSDREARAALVQGIAHAGRALQLDDEEARALEVRGIMRFFLWNTTPTDSMAGAMPLLQLARADLERATTLTRESSRAWNYLSIISFQQGDFARSYVAASQALATDEFGRNPLASYNNLFWAALEMGDFERARRGCAEIREMGTAAADYCRLVLTAWAPDRFPIDRAGVQSLVARGLQRHDADTLALRAAEAVILTRLGDPASGRAIALELERIAAHHPDLSLELAWIYSALGEQARARRLLDSYAAGHPARGAATRSGRFEAVRSAKPPQRVAVDR